MEQKFVWKNRDTDLTNVIRYHDPNHRFEIMYYRTNLLVHTRRLEYITSSLTKIAQKCYQNFDPNLAMLISRHHDDPELITGDNSLQLKLQMNDEEKEVIYQKELDAINTLCKFYPKQVGKYYYKDILLHSLNKDCREAQLHSFADKRDGECEAIHEVMAGNSVFLEPVLNYSQNTFSKRYEKFPLIKEMFSSDLVKLNCFLKFPVFDFMEIFQNGKRKASPHTEDSVFLDSKIPSYECWKHLTMQNFPNGLELLTKQTEFQ